MVGSGGVPGVNWPHGRGSWEGLTSFGGLAHTQLPCEWVLGSNCNYSTHFSKFAFLKFSLKEMRLLDCNLDALKIAPTSVRRAVMLRFPVPQTACSIWLIGEVKRVDLIQVPTVFPRLGLSWSFVVYLRGESESSILLWQQIMYVFVMA